MFMWRIGENDFMFKLCIDMTSLNNNQLMHSQFNIYWKHIKSSCKIYPDMFRNTKEPSSGGNHLILAKVYIWFNGASPYSQYYGGIRELQWKMYLLKQQVKSYMCIK